MDSDWIFHEAETNVTVEGVVGSGTCRIEGWPEIDYRFGCVIPTAAAITSFQELICRHVLFPGRNHWSGEKMTKRPKYIFVLSSWITQDVTFEWFWLVISIQETAVSDLGHESGWSDGFSCFFSTPMQMRYELKICHGFISPQSYEFKIYKSSKHSTKDILRRVCSLLTCLSTMSSHVTGKRFEKNTIFFYC